MTFGAQREIGFIIFKSSDNIYWNSISQKMAGNLYQGNFSLQYFATFFYKSHTDKSSRFKSIVKGRGWEGNNSLLVVALIGSLIVSLQSRKRKETSGNFTNINDENYAIFKRLAQ